MWVSSAVGCCSFQLPGKQESERASFFIRHYPSRSLKLIRLLAITLQILLCLPLALSTETSSTSNRVRVSTAGAFREGAGW